MLLAVHYRVVEYLGSLESTQEVRVARGVILRFFRALQTNHHIIDAVYTELLFRVPDIWGFRV